MLFIAVKSNVVGLHGILFGTVILPYSQAHVQAGSERCDIVIKVSSDGMGLRCGLGLLDDCLA